MERSRIFLILGTFLALFLVIGFVATRGSQRELITDPSLIKRTQEETPTKESTPSLKSEKPTPVDAEEPDYDSISEEVRQALIQKNGWDPSDDFTVKVDNILENKYAKGLVNWERTGGAWFAIKQTDEWIIVYDGNGVILCADVEPYPDYPVELISECYNEATQTLEQR